MKRTINRSCFALLAGLMTFAPLGICSAADTDPLQSTTVAAPVITQAPELAPVVTAAPPAAPVKLPYGVEDVLKLSRAQIGEEIILNYIHNSGTIYNLTPKDIVYLRDQGVSEKVVNAMLGQRQRVELAAQTPPPSNPVGPSTTPVEPQAMPSPENAAPATPESAPPGYAEAPLTPPASTTYTIPYPAATSAYYGYYYPYYGYYGPYYYGPSIAFSFGYPGHYHYYGGYHGSHAYHGGSYAHGGGHGGGHH
jgi:hypothetical protein